MDDLIHLHKDKGPQYETKGYSAICPSCSARHGMERYGCRTLDLSPCPRCVAKEKAYKDEEARILSYYQRRGYKG